MKLSLVSFSLLGIRLAATSPTFDIDGGNYNRDDSVPAAAPIWQSSGPKVHPNEPAKPPIKKSLEDAPSWSLTNVTRNISTKERVWMGFHIHSDGYETASCYMLVHVQGDPQIAAFATQPCVGSNFTVSWGYSDVNDAGIMTLKRYVDDCLPPRTMEGLPPLCTRCSPSNNTCWFGWNNVNDSEDLHDVGPNATTKSDDD